jgi:hypothetical protein
MGSNCTQGYGFNSISRHTDELSIEAGIDLLLRLLKLYKS